MRTKLDKQLLLNQNRLKYFQMHLPMCVAFGDWLASLTGECSLDAAGQPNSRISTNQLYLGFMVVVLGVYEIPQGNSHYILYVGSLIVLSSTLNQASVLPPAKPVLYSSKQLCIVI